MKKKNECRYYLEQLPMEGDYDNEVHEYINNLENEIKHQNKEDFDYYVNQLVDYYYQNQKLYFYDDEVQETEEIECFDIAY